jgi:hypothetical protein
MSYMDGRPMGGPAGGAHQDAQTRAESKRINGIIAGQENALGQLFGQLGVTYYENNKENPSPELAPLVSQITSMRTAIDSHREQLQILLYAPRCYICGSPLVGDTRFCNSCGTPVAPQPQAMPMAPTPGAMAPGVAAPPAPPGAPVCTQCGAWAKVGAAFCTGCGNPFPAAAAPEPAKTPASTPPAKSTPASKETPSKAKSADAKTEK